MTRERETLEIDVLFVGAGPASLAGAIHLGKLVAAHNASAAKKLELSIAVLENGSVRWHGPPRGLCEKYGEPRLELAFMRCVRAQ